MSGVCIAAYRRRLFEGFRLSTDDKVWLSRQRVYLATNGVYPLKFRLAIRSSSSRHLSRLTHFGVDVLQVACLNLHIELVLNPVSPTLGAFLPKVLIFKKTQDVVT